MKKMPEQSYYPEYSDILTQKPCLVKAFATFLAFFY